MLDYYSFKSIYGGIICLELSLIVVINYAVYNKWLYLITCTLTFMTDGGLASMLPALTVA